MSPWGINILRLKLPRSLSEAGFTGLRSEQKKCLASSEKPASEKQIRCLKAFIREQRISEEEICRENHVESLEELSGKTCWKLINALKKR